MPSDHLLSPLWSRAYMAADGYIIWKCSVKSVVTFQIPKSSKWLCFLFIVKIKLHNFSSIWHAACHKTGHTSLGLQWQVYPRLLIYKRLLCQFQYCVTRDFCVSFSTVSQEAFVSVSVLCHKRLLCQIQYCVTRDFCVSFSTVSQEAFESVSVLCHKRLLCQFQYCVTRGFCVSFSTVSQETFVSDTVLCHKKLLCQFDHCVTRDICVSLTTVHQILSSPYTQRWHIGWLQTLPCSISSSEILQTAKNSHLADLYFLHKVHGMKVV